MAAPELTNAEIADRLSLFAALLELAETNPFAVRAYVRAAELVARRPRRSPSSYRTGRVRELRGIGSGIEAKLRELVETGHIAELDDLNREIQPEIVGYGRLLGLTAKRVLDIARALDVRTPADLEAAIRDGRLREVPGVGAATEARIRAALERERAAPRGLTMNRSSALSEAIAAELGGEIAGPARRFSELAYELAVVCAADEPEPVIARFETLAAIVAVIERDERRAVGVTVDGVPVTLVVAKTGELRHRAAARNGLAGVRAGAGAVCRMPRTSRRSSKARGPVLPARAPRAASRRAAGRSRGAEPDPRRPALPYDLVGRKGDG